MYLIELKQRLLCFIKVLLLFSVSRIILGVRVTPKISLQRVHRVYGLWHCPKTEQSYHSYGWNEHIFAVIKSTPFIMNEQQNKCTMHIAHASAWIRRNAKPSVTSFRMIHLVAMCNRANNLQKIFLFSHSRYHCGKKQPYCWAKMTKTTATANERTNEHDSQRQGTERERDGWNGEH